MVGAIAHEKADALRAALNGLLHTSDGQSLDLPETARDVLIHLVDVLEASPDAVVFPADAVLSTQEVADVLGVSRMTVTRLIDRGELDAEGGGVHRRITASEVARYRTERRTKRRAALRELAHEITDDIPPDEILTTR
ncbi:MAG: helix-turn-helix domain-containing protein [Propionibacteriaceae bacterium]